MTAPGSLQHILRAGRFGLVGLSGVVVNTVVLYLLVARYGWGHLAAAAMATEVAILSNYLLNNHWTFRDRLSSLPWPQRVVRYNLIALGGLVISLAVLTVLTTTLGMHYLLANLVGICVATAWNYVANARLTWDAGLDPLAMPAALADLGPLGAGPEALTAREV